MSRQTTLWVLLITLFVCLGAAIYGYVHERGRPDYWRQAHELAAARASELEEEVEAREDDIARLQRDIARWEERFSACKELLAAASEPIASSTEDAPIDTGPPLPEDEDTSEPDEPHDLAESPLGFEIVDEELHDSPLKAQVVLQVLASGDLTANLTEGSLRALLTDLYSYAMAKRGFQYHEHATNVYIYVFTSAEYAASGHQWVAMLDKSLGDPDPDITVNETLIQQYRNPPQPETRFGMTEGQRRDLFREIVRAGDRAMIEAERSYPYLDPLASGYSQEAALARIQRQAEEQDRLNEIYRSALGEQSGLTEAELDAIVSEGLSKEWPLPPFGE